MAKVEKLPSGNYRARVFIGRDENGKQIKKSFTAETKKEAERMAAQYEFTEGNDRSVYKAIEGFIDKKSNILSPSSIRGYKSINNALKKTYPDIAYITIEKLNNNIMQDFINTLAKKKSAKTVRNYYTLITSATNKRFNVSLPTPKAIDYVIPTDDDIKKIIEEAKSNEVYIPILLGAFGMMRRSEICALTIDDISDSTIHISKAMVRNDNKQWVIKQPKTFTSDRYVNVPGFVIKEIKEKGYVTNLTPNLISDRFNRIVKRLGMKYHFHDLRHYSASVRHAIGIPDVYIMQEGGWSNDYVLKKIYRNTMEDYKSKMVDKTNEHFNEMMNKNNK